jgi:hypothetical protein
MVGNMSSLRVSLSALVVAAAGFVPATFAQIKRVESYRVVTTEKASLRCGDGELFYKVGEIPAGTQLTVDGESAAYLQVSYPAGLAVGVRAEDVEVQGSSIKLVKASKLKALNLATGWSGSWKGACSSDLAVGTSLKLIDAIKDGESGPILGYRVAAPDQARAYIEPRLTRRATAADAVTSPVPAETKPTESKPTEIKAVEPKGAEMKPAPAGTTPAAGPAASKPAAVDMTKPVEKPATQPAASKPADASAPTSVVQTTTPTPKVPEEAPAPVVVAREVPPTPGADLEDAFTRVMKEPIMNAEMDELVGQYNNALGKLGENDELLAKRLKVRRDALQIRIDLRDRMRKQADARAAIEAARGKVNEQIKLAEDGRVYTIIGQLQASTVYDGQKLPLMYRVVSVGGVSPRTLGYLKDQKELVLIGKVGAVVGVIGEAQLDRSLMLNVITPVRVDVLKPKSEVEGAAPSPAPAAPAAKPVEPKPAAEPKPAPETTVK